MRRGSESSPSVGCIKVEFAKLKSKGNKTIKKDLIMKNKCLSLMMCVVILSACSVGCGGRKNANFRPEKSYSDPDLIALCHAAKRGDIRTIDRLVAKGVDVNAKGKKRHYTPLFFALAGEQIKAFEALLKHKADPNIPSKDDVGSIMHATAYREHDSKWLELALKYGGKTEVLTQKGMVCKHETPLFKAISARNIKNVKLLIKAGANLNHQDTCGSTPVMEAATHLEYRIAYLLLQEGADWKLKEGNGKDLAYLCFSFPQMLDKEFPEGFKYNRKVLEFLREKGVDIEAAKMEAFKRNGKVYDVLKKECTHTKMKKVNGKMVKTDIYIPEGWSKVVKERPIDPPPQKKP